MLLKDMEAIHDYTHHKYVIKMMDPKDWIRHYNEGGEVVNDFILPRGPRQRDEFSDTVYHKGTDVPYHWHHRGFELFEIAKGTVDCVVDGKHFIAEEGDLIFLPPYISHGFVHLQEDNIWRELFQEIDMSGGIFEKNLVNKYYAEYKEDEEFMAMYREGKTMKREVPVVWSQEPVDRKTVHHLRTPEFAWVKYDGEGFSLKLKIARFETSGCKEVWNCQLKKGLCAEYKYPHKGYDMLYVKSGKLEVTVDHTYEHEDGLTWIVEGNSIIDIPPYHTYTIKVLEDSEVYNYGGDHYLQNCLEDLASVEANEPERIANEADRLKFLRSFGVYCTKMEYKPQ